MDNSNIQKNYCYKLNNNKGFTLTELLVGIVILMMMTMVVSGGVSLALREYQRSVFVSESNVLNTSLQAALADMLHYASDVGKTNDSKLYFINENYAINKGGYYFVDGNGKLKYKSTSSSSSSSVLNDGAYTDIIIKNFQINYHEASHVFYGKYRLQSKNVAGLTRDYYFVVQSMPEKLMAAN